jgi:hypothetical protein
MLEAIIPPDVVDIIEEADLLIYSGGYAKEGRVCVIGTMWPYQKLGKKPLTPEENTALRARIKKEILAAGYKCKVKSKVWEDTQTKDINCIVIRVLLKEPKIFNIKREKPPRKLSDELILDDD